MWPWANGIPLAWAQRFFAHAARRNIFVSKYFQLQTESASQRNDPPTGRNTVAASLPRQWEIIPRISLHENEVYKGGTTRATQRIQLELRINCAAVCARSIAQWGFRCKPFWSYFMSSHGRKTSSTTWWEPAWQGMSLSFGHCVGKQSPTVILSDRGRSFWIPRWLFSVLVAL